MGSSSEFASSSLMELIGHVAEAAVNPRHWSVFLDALEDYYPDSRLSLFGHENGRPTASLTFQKNFVEDDLRAYTNYYVQNSPYISHGLQRLPVGEARFSEAVISDQELETTEHYNDFIKPRRLGHYSAGVIIERSPQRSVALSMADQKNDPDRRERQLRLLNLLTPHLARAFRLHAMLDVERQRNQAAQAVFDTWANAAIVLTAGGQVVLMNPAAERLVAERDGLTVSRDSRLRCVDEVANRRLDDAILGLAANPDAANGRTMDGMALPRLTRSPLNVMLSRLPFLGGDADVPGGSILMVLVDPETARRAPAEWIARHSGLAPAETRLTELLINGETLAAAADQLGIQLSTARTRLKAIQAKTGCHRQADLVRLALSMPPMHCG